MQRVRISIHPPAFILAVIVALSLALCPAMAFAVDGTTTTGETDEAATVSDDEDTAEEATSSEAEETAAEETDEAD